MTDRRWKIALAASLTVNLFLVGLMAGSGLRDRAAEERPPPARHARFAETLERLDPADREALRALLRSKAEEARAQRQALRAANRELDAVMARPQYDPDGVRAALTRARAEESALRGEVDAALIAFAARLDPEERAALAPLLRKGRGWRVGQQAPQGSGQ